MPRSRETAPVLTPSVPQALDLLSREGGPPRLLVSARESVAAEQFDVPPGETAATFEVAALAELGLGAGL